MERDPSVQSVWLGTLRNEKIVDGRRKNASISNLKSVPKDVGYLSSPQYVREHLLGEKQKSADSDVRKSRTGSHRSVEELEDEMKAVKRALNSLSSENTQLQSRIRRLQEENKQKDSELQDLVNQQAEAQKALLTETADGKLAAKSVIDLRKAQSSALINSLKVRVGELQTELESTKAQLKRIQTDIKTTNINDLRVQSEVFYSELQRLRNLLPNEFIFDQEDENQKHVADKQNKDLNDRVSALQNSIETLNREKAELRTERSSMRKRIEKLEKELQQEKLRCERLKALDEDEDVRRKRESEKHEEKDEKGSKRLSKIDFSKFTNLTAEEDREHLTPKGSPEDRLDQYEKRESHLLSELRKRDKLLNELVRYAKQLEEDGDSLRKRVRKQEEAIQQLEEENRKLRKENHKAKVLGDLQVKTKERQISSSLSASDDDQDYSTDEALSKVQSVLRANSERKKTIENSPAKRASDKKQGRARNESESESASGSESDRSRGKNKNRRDSTDGRRNSDSDRSRSRSPSNASEKNRARSPTQSDRRSSIHSADAPAAKNKGKSSLICGGCTNGVVSPAKSK